MSDQPHHPLPTGWSTHTSSSHQGSVYYFNRFTGVTTWDLNDVLEEPQTEEVEDLAVLEVEQLEVLLEKQRRKVAEMQRRSWEEQRRGGLDKQLNSSVESGESGFVSWSEEGRGALVFAGGSRVVKRKVRATQDCQEQQENEETNLQVLKERDSRNLLGGNEDLQMKRCRVEEDCEKSLDCPVPFKGYEGYGGSNFKNEDSSRAGLCNNNSVPFSDVANFKFTKGSNKNEDNNVEESSDESLFGADQDDLDQIQKLKEKFAD